MPALWGGRFTEDTDALMWAFNASISVDQRMALVDIWGSQAYARAIQKAGVLTENELTELVSGLDVVADEFEQGSFTFADKDEDIHTAVERRLGEIVGPLAGKLHTGRSRNDQVATDVRLYMLESLGHLGEMLDATCKTIVDKAAEHIDVLMPGYTHMQPAQPVRFSHWLMSYFWMLDRDRERLADLTKRVSRCPLGAGALAGNAYGIDRQALAKDLGFDDITWNSMDAVADRDMIIECLSWGAQIGLHLSRLAEDIIIWSTREFGFVHLLDKYSTGSSIMPQKKNPDSMELVRGKTGRLLANLNQIMTVCKGIPSTYDKDLQEDKEALFDTIDTLGMLLPITAGVIATMAIDTDKMTAALGDELVATDIADYLVKKGLPFRKAHSVVGKLVLLSENKGVGLCSLSLEDYQSTCELFEADVQKVLSFEASVEARNTSGGTARSAVLEQIAQARQRLAG